MGPNTGALAPRARQKAGLGVGCGRGSHPPAVRVRRYHPRKIYENSDAKSCILVTTCCEISCFLKTTAKKLGDQYIVGPQPKVGGLVSPGPHGCRAYERFEILARVFVNRARCQIMKRWTWILVILQTIRTPTRDNSSGIPMTLSPCKIPRKFPHKSTPDNSQPQNSSGTLTQCKISPGCQLSLTDNHVVLVWFRLYFPF